MAITILVRAPGEAAERLPSAMAASPLLLGRWRQADECAAGDRDKAQLARLQQRVYGFANSGARRDMGKEVLDLFLVGGHGSLKILAEQGGDGFRLRDLYAFLHGFRRPAIKHIP